MKVCTEEGIDIYVLPDCAICKESGKSPLEMSECPIYNFDDTGYICVPELCDEYTEEWDE